MSKFQFAVERVREQVVRVVLYEKRQQEKGDKSRMIVNGIGIPMYILKENLTHSSIWQHFFFSSPTPEK